MGKCNEKACTASPPFVTVAAVLKTQNDIGINIFQSENQTENAQDRYQLIHDQGSNLVFDWRRREKWTPYIYEYANKLRRNVTWPVELLHVGMLGYREDR